MNTTAESTTQDQAGQQPAATHPEEARRAAPRALRRPIHDRMLGGVAAGVADYLGVDVTIVRIAFVVLTFIGGAAIPAYLAGWLLIPEEGSDRSVASDFFESRQR